MAYGGGTFTVQNKVLPGTYINFVSTASASASLSDRGTATMPVALTWGPDDEVFELTAADFQKYSLKKLGYAYTADELKGLRDLFLNANTVYLYNLASGGSKASCTYATAVYPGTRGNDIYLVIEADADTDDESESTSYVVTTYIGGTEVDEQTVTSASELEDNDYVTFDTTATLAATSKEPLSGGTDGTVTSTSYQNYMDKIEAYSFNTMGVATTDDTIKALFASFVERLRDEMGVKFQLVLYNYEADYMGTINVKNAVTDTDDLFDESSLVYWVTGASAGCAVNKSLQNTTYDGEFTVDTDYTQTELKAAIQNGEFVFHLVGDDVRVLDDINSMVTTSDDCGEVFQSNQTIRVIDQIANDVATTFNDKYLGSVQNDAAGRISLWSDIVKLLQQLEDIRAIEDFEDSDVVVEEGDTKKSVAVTVVITVVNAMSKLYMTVTVQ